MRDYDMQYNLRLKSTCGPANAVLLGDLSGTQNQGDIFTSKFQVFKKLESRGLMSDFLLDRFTKSLHH